MKQAWKTWMVFCACCAVAAAAMGWVTTVALRLDSLERAARRDAELEERVRLALWRMDSALAPLLAAENAAIMAAEHSVPAAAPIDEPGMPAPSFVLDYFRYNARDGYLPLGGAAPEAESAQRRLPEFSDLEAELRMMSLSGARQAAQGIPMAQPEVPPEMRPEEGKAEIKGKAAALNLKEYEARTQQFSWTNTLNLANASQAGESGLQYRLPLSLEPLRTMALNGAPQTLWLGNHLVLLRANGAGYTGCRLNWAALRPWLTDGIADLLPEAQLIPMREESDDKGRLLAGLPVRLEPGRVPAAAAVSGTLSPTALTLCAAWACTLLAGLAAAALLWGTLALSERRATFVSAVTHELRTPLTTFLLYTGMLADGMVEDEGRRRRYLTTLRTEAVRLGHLVENVLAYARVERRATARRLGTVRLGDLIERTLDRLERCLEPAQLELAVEMEPGASDLQVRADPSMVEQILLNLVNNAAKYATPTTDRRVHLEARAQGDHVEIRVRDHGPGVDPEQRKRLFRPFGKSAQQAAQTAPGIGLGLALSRRLARAQGGDLRLDDGVEDGAAFTLALATSGAQTAYNV